mgnify:CR=1 FL=1
MKIQRSDRQNKETSNIDKTEQTDMFSSIDHEIEESISKILKNSTSNIK